MSGDADSPLPFPFAVHVSEPGWVEVVGESPEDFVAVAVAAALEVLDAVPEGELSVALVSDAEIAELNSTYRNKDGATNVLAFPMGGEMQGDVVVALQTMLREAHRRRITARAHAAHLLVHGFLHLQGYDHMQKRDAEIMEALETRALETVGISDPYRIAS